jgi:hypothetical protein
MGAAWTPAPLLLLHHPLAYHLIHGRFHESSGNRLTIVRPLAVVGNKPRVLLDICLEFFHRFQELPRGGIRRLCAGCIQVHGDRFDLLQRTEDVAMPEVSFCTFQGLQGHAGHTAPHRPPH